MLCFVLLAGVCLAGGPEVYEGAFSPNIDPSRGAIAQELHLLPIPAPQVALVTHFENEIDPAIIHSIKEELASILNPMGVATDWVPLNEVEGRSFSQRLVVVRFKGRCSAVAGSNPYLKGPLGHAHYSDGKVLPFVELNCDKLLGFIGQELRRTPTPSTVAGIALGRVLGHELYHVIGDTTDHGRHGLTKPALTSAELTRGALRFDLNEASLMIQKLRPIKPRTTAPRQHAGL